MSSPMKLSLLALISTVAAVPQYGHSRFHHKPSGAYGTGRPAYPTGGWPGSNSTAVLPTGTGVYPEDKTTTLEETATSTTTLTSTVYLTAPKPGEATSVGGLDVTTGVAGCGPETITVTATNKVTITVPAGGASSSAEIASTSSVAEASEIPTMTFVPSVGYEAPSETPVASSTSAKEEGVTISIPHKPVETPASTKATEADYTTPAAPTTEVVPTSSAAVETSSAPVSSATPSSTSTPSYSGGKRGLAYNEAGLCSTFSGKASWAYNWGSAPAGDLPEGIKFIPLAWTKNEDAATWLGKVDEAVAGGSDVVMGFNEPDHDSQANMTPDVACENWSSYMNPIASAHSGVTILGPSVTNAGNDENMGLQWLKKFQDGCPGAIWHAANIHFYDIYQEGEGEAGTVGRFEAQVKKAAEQTGKKVWVTEFGLNPGATPDQAAKFLKGVMDFMDGSDLVEGYSYFMVGTGENQLLSGTGLSTVGDIYAATS